VSGNWGYIDLSRCSENWFYAKSCEQYNLDMDNITWTLVKFIEPECDHLGRFRMVYILFFLVIHSTEPLSRCETSAETYCTNSITNPVIENS